MKKTTDSEFENFVATTPLWFQKLTPFLVILLGLLLLGGVMAKVIWGILPAQAGEVWYFNLAAFIYPLLLTITALMLIAGALTYFSKQEKGWNIFVAGLTFLGFILFTRLILLIIRVLADIPERGGEMLSRVLNFGWGQIVIFVIIGTVLISKLISSYAEKHKKE